MLKELHIKNIVLIKDIKINFFEGFSVFSGETGAGKSILLDSLALCLGERADFSLIRKGEDKAEITAIFKVDKNHPSLVMLKNNEVAIDEDQIIIRKIILQEGKSKSFINDTSVTVSFLRQVGELLLDIHGQFDNARLINQPFHREILDSFLPDKSLLSKVEVFWEEYKSLRNDYKLKLQEIEGLEKEREYIEHSLEELQVLDCKENEEKELLEKKYLLQNFKKINNNLFEIEKNLVESDILSHLYKTLKIVDNTKSLMPNNEELDSFINIIDSAYINVSQAMDFFNKFKDSLEFDELEFNKIEERIIELRHIAKKHKVSTEDLPVLMEDFSKKLFFLKENNIDVKQLKQKLDIKYEEFKKYAKDLSNQRSEIALNVQEKVNQELLFLKLEHAEFKIFIFQEGEGNYGFDKVVFKVKTNKGVDFGDLNKIASGGEMARFMLALKIILAEVEVIGTLILDEIDIGVGGEVAEAIGKRLLYLSSSIQTIVVTHSHQVASKGEYHYKVIKEVLENGVFTKLKFLNKEDRIQEIARMLSGSEITDQAIATANILLRN